jgi:choline-sulfatase
MISVMSNRPNIVFLMADQLGAWALAPDSGCLTPNLDRLAEEAVQFRRCYTPNAICSPSRASLMTGLYPSTHGMWDCTHTQRAEWVDVPADRFTYFSHRLADAGYRNGYFGKWHVEQSDKLENFGWHEYDVDCEALVAHDEHDKFIESTEERVPAPGYRDFLFSCLTEGGDELTHPAYQKGIDFIRRQTSGDSSDQPFCCFISTIEPHDPYIAPRQFYEMYDIESVRTRPTIRNEPHGKPDIVKRMRSVWTEMSDEQWRRITAAYFAVITYLDSQIGRVIAALKESGAYDNTIIVFTSDHGDMMGAHGLATKGPGTSYEEVYNIPMILRAPEMTSGRNDSQTLTSLVDLAPTLLDLCGVEPIEDAQGRSLRPVLEGRFQGEDWQDAYAEFFGQRYVYTQRIVWHGDLKYVFSPGGIDELYDLSIDPHEQTNLVDDPAHRDTLIEMTKRMWRTMKRIGDDSLFNAHYATMRTAPVGQESIADSAG